MGERELARFLFVSFHIPLSVMFDGQNPLGSECYAVQRGWQLETIGISTVPNRHHETSLKVIEAQNPMVWISTPEEYHGAAVFIMNDTSSL
jgi:hypothetical protein